MRAESMRKPLAADAQVVAVNGPIGMRITPVLDCLAHIQAIKPNRRGADFSARQHEQQDGAKNTKSLASNRNRSQLDLPM